MNYQLYSPVDNPRRFRVWGEGEWYVLTEEQYQEINQWCKDTLGYHARTAHDTFDFKKSSDMTLFVLRWS